MSRLEDELQRQWKTASIIDEELQTKKSWESGILTLQNQPQDFRDALQTLLLQMRSSSCSSEARSIVISNPLTWKIPAFCLPTPYFSDPGQMILRSNALQTERVFRNPSKRNTLEFWVHKTLKIWIAPTERRILLIQGQYNTTHHMEHFGLEMTKFLSTRKPVVFILSSFSNTASRLAYGDIPPEQLLRQLCIQVLEKISIPQPLLFLANILEHFQTASSCIDWLKILCLTAEHVTDLHVVLDLGVVNIEHAKLLRRTFQSVLCEPESKSRLKVMLMTSRKLQPVTDTTEIAISPAGGPYGRNRSPFKLGLPSVQESLRSILEGKTTEATSASNSEPISVVLEESMMAVQGSRSSTSDARQAKSALTSNLSAFIELDSHSRTPQSLKTRKEMTFAPVSVHDCTHDNCVCCRPNNTEAISRAPTSSFDSEHRFTQGLPILTFEKQHKITIAILCALPLESDAIEGQLDEYYRTESLSIEKVAWDTNTYSRGRIGRHHIVLVHLAGMGKRDAVAAATNCRASFPDINLALVVGICGGVPSYVNEVQREIVLGDVVISEGLVPFDFGRRYPDQFVMKDELVDILGKPPLEIRSLLSKLKTQNGRRYLTERTRQYLGDLSHDLQNYAVYPGVAEDKLYEETYRHKHRSSSPCRICNDDNDLVCETARYSSCEDLRCSNDNLVHRTRLDQQGSHGPSIHLGLMASGDQVMKSGEHRNDIAKRHNVIAFEMEGAGVWDTFPCMVIKGVCDYADSHKNKKWQRYAAATAAACMKALLDEWTMTG